MLELLFLLLPVAAAYGWYMGRRSAQQGKQQEANRLSREYVTGVNFLLSNQQDKAVDLFLDMLKEDATDVEAHLTLGNLFRSRGEVDRAIRIHQSLMESTSLDYDQRLLAMQQLGRDYLAAGFYDRAESMFKQLINENDFKVSSLKQLLSIYQLTSDWQQAIDIAEKLARAEKSPQGNHIAHFYCELALQAMAGDDLERALTLLRKAESADKNCARVSIMFGRVWTAKGEPVNAIQVLQKVPEQDAEMISEVLPLIKESYQRLGDMSQWRLFLEQCVEKHQGSMAELYLAEEIESQQGLEPAQHFLEAQLHSMPTLNGFHRLVNYYLEGTQDGRAKESLAVLRDMVGEQLRLKPRYRCQKCGFTAHAIYWHCPSCKSWSTVKPMRGLDS
ncbi:Lipopolysaccharide biosynthesis regulator YciM, contains six TPR domains and a predicted metal-binding C-terminal domain [Rosenbergiella nectarea]|uniref:Lipopolysaccharide assembly protein B n=1 Tax=Rosenbergiella nectarea TaxID=988801 RepID=A0A1H9G026_9GAMM|nr:lipopolysaccharide assembly protein LapB [Rosenbergiella nectarea]SEQ43421.1 Lipopolysaccharide biosynthesis regulator YciM, contains six TPR domains and a predicted metal-binding C-terminal domain [Rosenbergiella nectarea]